MTAANRPRYDTSGYLPTDTYEERLVKYYRQRVTHLENLLCTAHGRFVDIAELLPAYERLKGTPFEEVFRDLAEALPDSGELHSMLQRDVLPTKEDWERRQEVQDAPDLGKHPSDG